MNTFSPLIIEEFLGPLSNIATADPILIPSNRFPHAITRAISRALRFWKVPYINWVSTGSNAATFLAHLNQYVAMHRIGEYPAESVVLTRSHWPGPFSITCEGTDKLKRYLRNSSIHNYLAAHLDPESEPAAWNDTALLTTDDLEDGEEASEVFVRPAFRDGVVVGMCFEVVFSVGNWRHWRFCEKSDWTAAYRPPRDLGHGELPVESTNYVNHSSVLAETRQILGSAYNLMPLTESQAIAFSRTVLDLERARMVIEGPSNDRHATVQSLSAQLATGIAMAGQYNPLSVAETAQFTQAVLDAATRQLTTGLPLENRSSALRSTGPAFASSFLGRFRRR